jgi:flagellar biosynthesis protein FlhA
VVAHLWYCRIIRNYSGHAASAVSDVCALLGAGGWWLGRERAREARRQAAPASPPTETGDIDIGVVELVQPLEVQVGYRLVGLVSQEHDGGLLRRLRAVRRQVSREFGFLVPVVHVRDNPDLQSSGYRILVHGVEKAAGEVHADKLLAMPAGSKTEEIPGISVRDPVFGRPAKWIAPTMAEQASAAGHTVFDAAVVVATHFERVVEDNIESLFGRSELDALLAFFGKQAPKLVEELTPKLLPLTTVHRVLCGLLAERVPISDLRNIIASLVESAATTQEAQTLLAALRLRLGGFIVQNLFGAVAELKMAALEPDLERLLQEVLRLAVGSGVFAIEPSLAAELRTAAELMAGRLAAIAPIVALLTSTELRQPLAELLRTVRPRIWVFSYQEIPSEKQIKVVELLGRPAQTHA